MIYYPDRAIVYHLAPGQGAPLDSPIPITQLAFGGAGPLAVERMVTLIELLAEIARAIAPRAQGPARPARSGGPA
jgi:hypothetical protein